MFYARNGKTHGIDEISQVLGDGRYASSYFDDGLRLAVLGPHSPHRIAVSRCYLLMQPKVIVDFEPLPVDGPFFVEEKRKYFAARGIAYVPIFLRETLTADEFAARVREARRLAEVGPKVAKEDAALRSADPPPDRLPPVEMSQIDREALRLLEVDIQRQTHLRGAARAGRLAAIKRRLIAERRGEVVARLRLPMARPRQMDAAARPRKPHAGIAITAQAAPLIPSGASEANEPQERQDGWLDTSDVAT